MRKISHTAIRNSLQTRILSGEWTLGERIPDEANLAEEYGCARTTVNRALRALAEDGLVVRKRKGGTRVNPAPVRTAKLSISVIREQVEAAGHAYDFKVLKQSQSVPPKDIQDILKLSENSEALYLETLHFADNDPFVFETRWVNLSVVPEILGAPLSEISVNEWLVRTVPFSSGDVEFSAVNAPENAAGALSVLPGAALFAVDRTTWLGKSRITTMTQYYRQGYRLKSQL